MNGSWHFELTQPLCFLALAVLPLLFLYRKRSLVRQPRGQQKASLAVRILLLLLIVAAAAGPKVTVKTAEQTLIAVVDRSASVARDVSKITSPFRNVVNEEVGIGPGDAPGNESTDLASAITRARAEIPADHVGRIVLLSDGNQTTGDAVAAARAAGVPVSTVPLPGPEHEVFVASLTGPRSVHQGEPFDLELVVQSTHEDDATLDVICDTLVLDTQKVHLAPGENRFHLPQLPGEGPASLFTVKVGGCKDTLAENNQASCIVLIGPRPRVLLVESKPVLAQHLAAALKGENVDVEVRGPQDMPDRLDELRRYDLLILSNVPALAMSPQRMETVRTYVRDFGGGLVTVGGDQAFTPGGYRGTVLEDALPVISEVKRVHPKPSLAMVLVLDISASMGDGQPGRRSIDLAKEALRRAVGMLGPRDQVGVVEFNDRSDWIAPLQPATDKQKIIDRINAIEAAGGTTMYPPIEQAYLALRETFADLKHIIVLTDGLSNPGDFDAVARQIASADITMSMVGVGDEPAEPLLKRMAEIAKGHPYFCKDASQVPKIFELETMSAGKMGITEEPFSPQVFHAAQAMRGLDLEHAPRLLGYVETQPKPGCNVVLRAETGEPLLATWRYGLGTSAAFTSDISQSRWASAWLKWPKFGPFWAQLVRQTMRTDPMRSTAVRAEAVDGRLRVTLDAVDRDCKLLNGAEASVTVIDAKQQRRQAAMPQTAPGRYAATLLAEPGPYFVETRLNYAGDAIDTERLGFVMPYGDEFRIRPVNTALLRAIAEASGGQFEPKPDALTAPSAATASRILWLWPYLLVAAMVLFLLDIYWKRVTWRE
jgi:uncharacterized membrane protein